MFNRNTLWFTLLLFVPISLLGHWLNWNEVAIFITAGLAIVPLAAFMGEATGILKAIADKQGCSHNT